jgi:hypothetical protein
VGHSSRGDCRRGDSRTPRVHSEHKCWEAHQHTGFISPIEAAATLGEMGVEAVERHHKTGDMEGIAN